LVVFSLEITPIFSTFSASVQWFR